MAKKDLRNNHSDRGAQRGTEGRPIEQQSTRPNDLPDSPADREQLRNEETLIDLPDVSDIPGQEHVTVPRLDAIGDTTIASDDEEGVGVFDQDDSEDFTEGTSADVSSDEKRTLANADYMPTRDEDNLQRARMDNVDFDGEPLNEKGFGTEVSGRDLDVPGGGNNLSSETTGSGDEENSNYSLSSGDDNDDEG